MSFPDKLTATLTGTTTRQLYSWRSKGVLIPEVQASNPALYSFRDLVAVRTVAFLRSQVSFQKVRKAFDNLRQLDYLDHPSTYRFGTDGKTIAIEDRNGSVVDLVDQKGQLVMFTLEEIFREFTNFAGSTVVDFERPLPRLEVNPHRMGGWPTIAGTRVPYDAVSDLLADGYYSPADVEHFFPSIVQEDAEDALQFSEMVESHKRGA